MVTGQRLGSLHDAQPRVGGWRSSSHVCWPHEHMVLGMKLHHCAAASCGTTTRDGHQIEAISTSQYYTCLNDFYMITRQ